MALLVSFAVFPAEILYGDESARPAQTAGGSMGGIPVNPEQEEALLKLVGTNGKIFKTAHFVIASDADPQLVNSLSLRLERTYEAVDRFCVKSGFVVKPLERRLEVLFFEAWSAYRQYGEDINFNCEGTYGFYSHRTNISTFFNVENDPQLVKFRKNIDTARANAARMERTIKSIRGRQTMVEVVFPDGQRKSMTRTQAKNELETNRRTLRSLDYQRQNYCDRINQMVLQHELAHQVLFNTGVHVRGGRNPRWLVEGLACIFETPPGTSGGGIGTINQSRLKDFRTAVVGTRDAANVYTSMYPAAVKKGAVPSIKSLVTQPELFDERGTPGANNYAAAWALVHYLHRAHHKALPEYLQVLASRKRGQKVSADEELALFEQHFGSIDDAFAARFSSFILTLPYKATKGLK